MTFCVIMCMLLLCAGDVERCPGPTQTRSTSFEAKSMQGVSGKSDPPQRRRPRPTEEVLETSWRHCRGLTEDSQGQIAD